MKLSTGWHAGVEGCPAWFLAMLDRLKEGGADAPRRWISPTDALNELLAITKGMVSGHGVPQLADRKSLKEDVLRSFDCFGPASLALHKVALNDFRARIARLVDLLEDNAGARTVQAAASVLLGELGQPESRRAAFRDCVRAFEDDEPVGLCELRLLCLRGACTAGGHEWFDLERRAVGALQAADHEVEGETKDASPSVETRLERCENVLSDAPRRGEAVVWIAFGNALVADKCVSVGPVDFYDGSIWSSVFMATWSGGVDWVVPFELGDPDTAWHFDRLPDEPFVLVRVVLDDTPLVVAGDRARDLARAALELSGWSHEWELMDGEAVFASGRWQGGSGMFHEPFKRRPSPFPELEPVATELRTVEGKLLGRLAAGDISVHELLADLRWRRAVREAPDPEHRIPLYVALIERALTPSAVGSDKWYGACERYVAILLSLDAVTVAINDAGYYAAHRLVSPLEPADPARVGEFRSLRNQIIADDPAVSLKFHVRTPEVIRLAANLRTELQAGSMERRLIEEVERRTKDGPTAANWLEEEEQTVGVQLRRARRQRNSVAHGIRTVPAIAEDVASFLDSVTQRIIGLVWFSVDEGVDVIEAAESWRLAQLKKRQALRDGAPPEEFFAVAASSV